MKPTILFLGLFTLISNISLHAQQNYIKSANDARELSKKVMQLFLEGEYPEMFDEIRTYWPLPPNEIDQMESQTIRYGNMFTDRFGEVVEFQKTGEEVIADFAIRETYILRYGFSAIRVKFTYYLHPKGWILNAFTWDDTFTDEFVPSKE